MSRPSTLKVLVLLSTFFLTTFATTISLDCRYAYGGSDTGVTTCQSGDSPDSQHICNTNSCFSHGQRWVNIDNCKLDDSNDGVSQQRCEDYMWIDDSGSFSCTNPQGNSYHCKSTPNEIASIQCGVCKP
ncbi:secreted protein [Melampsora americana]|nr:secreted protein [Melampsora americana]